MKKGLIAPLLFAFSLMAGRSPAITLSGDGEKSTAHSSAGAKKSAGTDAASSNAKSSGTATQAHKSEMDLLLAILVQKHLLSEEDATSVRGEVKKQEETLLSVPPDKHQVITQSEAPQPPTPAQASEVKGKEQEMWQSLPFKISGFAQVQWSSLPGAGSTFQVRRGRLIIEGDVHKRASYKIQVETLNSPSLLDAYLQLKPRSYANFTFGQFKIPFSQESLISSSDLLTVERSQVVNNLVPGRDIGSQGRDIGGKFSGSLNFSDSWGVDYAVGVFNGAGINKKDDNNRKDVGVRLSVRPLQGLALSGDYYNGTSGPTEIARDREDAEIAYTYRPLTLQGEFVWGRDGAVHKQGWYGLAAWRFSKPWEAVFRVDAFDPNRLKAGNNTTTYLGGYNWYFARHLKWQLNEGLQNARSTHKNVLLSQLQFQF
ncbi:MAG TPA: porin [Candidatus Acidoferrales bacterium]|nr:porin [Candidatus Acidoferrales bacterium]